MSASDEDPQLLATSDGGTDCMPEPDEIEEERGVEDEEDAVPERLDAVVVDMESDRT